MKHLKIFTSDTDNLGNKLIEEAQKFGITLVVVNIDKEKAIADIHQVNSTPTLKLYRDDKLVKYYTGNMDIKMIQTFIA